MTDTANAPEREAGTPGPHEPDYKTAMLYHSDRADAYMGERDALTAELAKLRADLAEAQAKIARLTEALINVLNACDQGRMVPAPGHSVGGMSIDANIRGSVYHGVPAWPIEEARAALQENANG